MGSTRPRGVLRIARRGVLLAAAGAALLLAFGFLCPAQLRRTDPWFVHVAYAAFIVRTFVVYIGFGLAGLAAIALLLRKEGTALACLAMCAFALITGLPAPAHTDPQPGTGSDTEYLRVFSANLGVGRADPAEVLRQIGEHHPDVVLFQEYTPAFAVAVRDELRQSYPNYLEEGHADAFGQAVFSRLPFVGEPEPYPQTDADRDGHTTDFVSPVDPQIRFVVEVGGREVVIQNTHLSPPLRPAWLGEQRVQAARVADWAEHETRPMVAMGDFNCTGTSAQAAALRRAGLREGGGGTTWPTTGLKRHLPGFRLDRCYSKGLARYSSAVGERTGSDHRPIVVELAVP